jgi:hypothetical protein
VNAQRVRLSLGLAAGLVLGACNWSCKAAEALPLPCGITGIRWHMSKEELKRVRPGVRWVASTSAYHETVDACQPFLARATYVFSWWRGLTRVDLYREWDVSSPADLDPLIPGFLSGCRTLWGIPEGIEVFTRPKSMPHEYWNVGMWWDRSWGGIYAFYSSPHTPFPVGRRWLATMQIQMFSDGVGSFRARVKGDVRPEAIAKHFPGFPRETEVQGATLR